MVAKTPPMGFNTWNTFGNDIHEDLIKETADAMVDHGLAELGYAYLVIDDCWSERERNAKGELVADPQKFPNGMKAVSDYVHSKGLKFGMYSCAGTRTCAWHPGSFDHEYQDAKTFASWGVDFLKYDYCSKPLMIPGEILYRRIAMALRNCGREILFSACNWGCDGIENWVRGAGIHMWRSTGDIEDNWVSLRNIAMSQMGKEYASGTYCFNDMDMLVVGMYGKGNVGLGGCSDTEYKTHFSLWCLMNSPLMIGCDVRSMTKETKDILCNKDMIAINQDIEGRQGYSIKQEWNGGDKNILVKPLSNGDYVIGLFNLSDSKSELRFTSFDFGLTENSKMAFSLTDVWEDRHAGTYFQDYRVELEPHDCQVLRAKIVER